MLKAITEEQKDVIFEILENDDPSTFHHCDNASIFVDGALSFDAMAQIVDYLREQNNK